MPKLPLKTDSEPDYALGAASRVTGLSPEVLRAWERRYGAVRPARTPGGTRRYSAGDIERLRLLKAAVDAGSRIGDVVRLDDAELSRRANRRRPLSRERLDEAIRALDRYEGAEAQRLLAIQLSALGPVRFANDFALPLLRDIGERWADGRTTVASEHLASAALGAMLGSALQPTAAERMGPRVVFATPPGERHALGLQMAALTAMGAGAAPLYLGADLPVRDTLDAIERSRASAVALSLVTLDTDETLKSVGAVRAGVAPDVRVWIGGAQAANLPPIDGVERFTSLDAFESRILRLRLE